MEANAPSPTIVLIGTDAALLGAVAASAGASNAGAVRVLAEAVDSMRAPEIDTAAVVVVDIDPEHRRRPSSPSKPMRSPLPACADDRARRCLRRRARALVPSIRLADFIRKPIKPREILEAPGSTRSRRHRACPGTGDQILSSSRRRRIGTTTLADRGRDAAAREQAKDDFDPGGSRARSSSTFGSGAARHRRPASSRGWRSSATSFAAPRSSDAQRAVQGLIVDDYKLINKR